MSVNPTVALSPPLWLLGAVSLEPDTNVTPRGVRLEAILVELERSIHPDLWLIPKLASDFLQIVKLVVRNLMV